MCAERNRSPDCRVHAAIAIAANYDLLAFFLPDDQVSGREPSGIHTFECARITVAGQWRIFTALPEHPVAEQWS